MIPVALGGMNREQPVGPLDVNQEVAVANKKGGRALNVTTIHPLRLHRGTQVVHRAEPAVRLPDVCAGPRFRRFHPSSLAVVERVGGGGLKLLPLDD